MTTPLEPTILTMIVPTASGVSREHMLNLGAGKRSAVMDRMRARVATIEERMEDGDAITLENPVVTYNCSLVESVVYRISGASTVALQISEAMDAASRPRGFGRP